MSESKGTVEAIPREEIPEDLSTLKWAVLQKTAKRTLGINPRQKRPYLEFAVQTELGRECVPPPEPESAIESEPEPPRPPEASPVERIEAEMATMHNPGPEDRSPPRPHVNVEDLPDLAKGERPLEVEVVAPPAPLEPDAPPVEALPPVAAPEPVAVEDNDEFPDPPVLYYSSIAKLRIIVSVGTSGHYDQDRLYHEGIPIRDCWFGMTPNQLYTFNATKAWQVKAIEGNLKFKKGLVWRAADETKAALAQMKANVAALEAKLEGADSATIQERMRAALGGMPVVQGARNTRTAVPAVVSAENSPPWEGVDALLAGGGRLGAAARDGMRHAEARGEFTGHPPGSR